MLSLRCCVKSEMSINQVNGCAEYKTLELGERWTQAKNVEVIGIEMILKAIVHLDIMILTNGV